MLTDWQPVTDAEAAMGDALRKGDQELYFHILSRLELLLPVAPDVETGRAATGWGTWTTGGRTHVLAFTSPQAMRSCLAGHNGAARTVPYAELAAAWPNEEWWLAINPGLPIEGYLPAWFVAQLSRGDVRLPGRTIGARARVEAAAAARAEATATAGVGAAAPVEAGVARARGAAAVPVPVPASSPPPVPPAPGGGGLPRRRPGSSQFGVDMGTAGAGLGTAGAGRGLPPRRPVTGSASVASAARAEPPPSRHAPATGQPGTPEPPAFEPGNEVEADLLTAATDGQTDDFLSTLLLAKVLVPVAPGAAPSVRPGEPGFVWRREDLDGKPYVVVFTSPQRLADHLGPDVPAVTTKFVQLIRVWPEESWSFAVNPGTPVGATLPGGQIRALAAWAAEVGLTDEPSVEFETPEPTPEPGPEPAKPASAEVEVGMQKAIPPTQVSYFLERGYDRVSGFVHRASEVAHLTTPEQLYTALGLGYPGSPFKPSDEEMYVLRWTAYRPDLYRIPYGGRDESGMRAMRGWMIERAPFRGNGFAPGETTDVIAEFKVDSVRLPHGAQMWRLTRDGEETLIALFDADEPRWVNVSPGAEQERG